MFWSDAIKHIPPAFSDGRTKQNLSYSSSECSGATLLKIKFNKFPSPHMTAKLDKLSDCILPKAKLQSKHKLTYFIKLYLVTFGAHGGGFATSPPALRKNLKIITTFRNEIENCSQS